jgi:signal transduction histidine kinase
MNAENHPSEAMRDRSARRRSREDFRALFHKILHHANRGLPRLDFLKEVGPLLLDFSDAAAVELRLLERRRHYRCEILRGREQADYDVQPLMENDEGQLLPSPAPASDFDRLCWDLVRGRLDPSPPVVTENGSIRVADTSKPATISARTDGIQRNYRAILAGPFASLLFFPIAVENANIGLVILKSTTEDFFKEEEVTFYESLGHNLGVALAHRRAQVALRERVKELTCLYGISRLVEQPDISLEQLLKGIVDLLPPAWLYPEIAQGRILLNGDDYSTPNFKQSHHRQSATIVAGGVARGSVEVGYTESRPDLDEGPFLKEERSLIDTIARELAQVIERRHADRLATIGQLAAGVAHELNEPLGNILGFAQLAQKAEGLPEQAAADLDKIIRASLYAREVIKKLMIFSRQVSSRKERVSLNKVVEDSLNLLSGRLSKGGIEVKLELQERLPEVAADAAQLNQVLVNLVVNAAQAMPDGGVLTIKTSADEEDVFLDVSDTGIGMSEEVKSRIFLPFFTTKDVSQGTGLGLAVVHGIITAHGGSIQVVSEEGQGSKFTIRLPIAPGFSPP